MGTADRPLPTRREDTGPTDPTPPGVTRREGEDPPRAGQAATRREFDEPTPGWPAHLTPDLLPPTLAGRLTDLTPMPAAGGEAVLMRVRDAAYPDAERVLKVYFPHIEPDAAVSAQLTEIRSKHVVEIVETGTLTDGRMYELMAYLPGGSLRDAGAGRRAFDTASVVEIVRQLATGLAALHERRITHRDLKPENVLVRGTSPDIELVLTDFGLSRKLNTTAHFTTVARTPAYAAPEAWVGHVSPALDWWALGLIVLELVTGQQPFAGLDDLMIQKAVTTKPVPVDAVTDPRLNRLCAGLLVSDETKRWQGDQVREWLAGGLPAVPDRRVPVEATEFEFDGQRFRDPESLAVAMAKNWRLAARRFGFAPSPSFRALTTWLHQFDDPDQYPVGVVEERLDLLGRLERSKETPNAKLLRLLAGLNPQQPPIFRQAHIDEPKLRALARQAQDGQDGDAATTRAREIVDELWDGRLLKVLARFDGAAPLARVDQRWADGVDRLRAAVRTLKANPELTKVFTTKRHRSVARAAMLEVAAGGVARGDDWVRELAGRARALPVSIDWFDGLVRWAGTDAVRAYAALFASGVAQAQANAVVLAQQAAARAEQARQQAWADHEARRLAGRSSAMGRAAAGAGVLTFLWLLVIGFATNSTELAVVVVPLGTHWAAELVLANDMGADYHPTYSLWQSFQVAVGRIGGRMRGSPRGWLIGIVLVLIALGVVSWLVPLAAVVATVAHIVWAVRRHQRWSAVHEQEHQQVLNQ